MRLDDSQAKEQ